MSADAVVRDDGSDRLTDWTRERGIAPRATLIVHARELFAFGLASREMFARERLLDETSLERDAAFSRSSVRRYREINELQITQLSLARGNRHANEIRA